MPKSIEESTASGSVTHIGNKIKRQEVYRKHAKDKAKAKLEKRIKRAQEEKEEGGKEKKRVSGNWSLVVRSKPYKVIVSRMRFRKWQRARRDGQKK